MFVPEIFIWIACGFGCYGVLCLVEEFFCWLRDKKRTALPVRLVLLFHDNEQNVEWFVRRLQRVLRVEGKAKVSEVFFVDIASQDNTPRILERLSSNHPLFHYAPVEQNALLVRAGNSLVIDCRSADWSECLKRVRLFLSDGKRGVGE
ncbi:MAG: hypothetical protein AAGU32_18295 [Bacillota bacterium]